MPSTENVANDDAISGGISDARNSAIFNMFSLINVGERSGIGLCDVYSAWKANGYKEPEFVETVDPDRITLTLTLEIEVRDKKAERCLSLCYTTDFSKCTDFALVFYFLLNTQLEGADFTRKNIQIIYDSPDKLCCALNLIFIKVNIVRVSCTIAKLSNYPTRIIKHFR